jgi:hypothetical protein
MNLARSPALEGKTGLYFNGLYQAEPQAQAYDRHARDRLRGLSLAWTGLAPDR